MTGTITIKNKTYVFRDDHGHGDGIWAWDIQDDYTKGMTHKWSGFPNGSEVIFFDIDNPPQTIPFIPIIN